MRLKNKIMLQMIFTIIVSIITLSAIFYILVLVDVEVSMKQAYEKSMYQLADKLSYVFEDLKNTSNSISSDITFLQMLEVYEQAEQSKQMEQSKQNEYKHTIKKMLPHHAGNYTIAYDSILCTITGDIIVSGAQDFFYTYDAQEILESFWFYESQDDFQKIRFTDSEFMFDRDVRDSSFYIISTLNDFYSGKQLATLRIGFSNKYLVHELKKVLDESSQVYIVNENGYIVCSSETFDKAANKYFNWEPNQTKNIKLEVDIGGTPWKLIGIMDYPVLSSQKARILLIIIISSSVCLIFSLLLVKKISNEVSQPIEKLIDTVQTIQKGQFEITVPAIHHDEISLLGLEIQNMANHLESLIQENLEKEERKRKAEVRFLSAQISPHFLNNTLKSIAALAQFNRTEEIEQTILALTKLLKTTMSGRQETVLLKEELDILKSYLMIMEIRYNYGIDYSLEVNPKLENLYVPKLIFQPLVENSIFHGMNEKNSFQFHIHIYVDYLVENHSKVIFRISDNGSGMDEDRVKQLKEKMNTPKEDMGEDNVRNEQDGYASIGMVNVKQRLNYYYPNVTFSFESILNVGTTVEIVLCIEDLNENIIG